MLVLDVNVLVAAFRADHPHHGIVRPWWDALFDSGEPVAAPDLVLAGFTRVVTTPRVFDVPATMAEALAFLDVLVAHAAFRFLETGPAVYAEFRSICLDEQVTGNLVTDAWIAACARASACPVATMDRDFRRFERLRLVTPRLDD